MVGGGATGDTTPAPPSGHPGGCEDVGGRPHAVLSPCGLDRENPAAGLHTEAVEKGDARYRTPAGPRSRREGGAPRAPPRMLIKARPAPPRPCDRTGPPRRGPRGARGGRRGAARWGAGRRGGAPGVPAADTPARAEWCGPQGRGSGHVTRPRPPFCPAVLVFRAQRLTGRVAFASAGQVASCSPLLAAPGPTSPRPWPADLAPSPPADMSEAKSGPEYASFFAVMGASAAMVFSGERRGRRDPGDGGRAGLVPVAPRGSACDVIVT